MLENEFFYSCALGLTARPSATRDSYAFFIPTNESAAYLCGRARAGREPRAETQSRPVKMEVQDREQRDLLLTLLVRLSTLIIRPMPGRIISPVTSVSDSSQDISDVPLGYYVVVPRRVSKGLAIHQHFHTPNPLENDPSIFSMIATHLHYQIQISDYIESNAFRMAHERNF